MSDIVYIWIGWLFDIESVVKRRYLYIPSFHSFPSCTFQTNACTDQTYYFRTKRFHVRAFFTKKFVNFLYKSREKYSRFETCQTIDQYKIYYVFLQNKKSITKKR